MAEPLLKRHKASNSSSEVSEDEEVQDVLPRASLCPQRLRGIGMKLVNRINDDYLAMLRDVHRNDFYWTAMEKLPVRGQRVLDLGAGTGLLSLMAAKLGASSVLAVEESADMAAVVKTSAEHNRLQHIIDVHAGHSALLSLAEKDKADVIVSETFGVLLLQEGCLKSFIHARENLAKPGASILPAGGAQHARLLASTALRSACSALDPEMLHVNTFRDAGHLDLQDVAGRFTCSDLCSRVQDKCAFPCLVASVLLGTHTKQLHRRGIPSRKPY